MRNLKSYILAFVVAIVSLSTIAQELPSPQAPPRLVNDFAGVLSNAQNAALENKLRSFNDTTSTQIVVLTTPDLLGYDISDYATRIAEKWGVGQKGKDNGIMVIVKPKTSDSKGQIYIAVGYGLEGIVPDVIARRIVDNEIIPYFARGNMYGGIDVGTDRLMGLVSGEFTAESYVESGLNEELLGVIILIALFIIISLLSKKNRHTTVSRDGGHTSGGAFFPPIIMGGGYGSSRSDSGFGGGGFGGFGGGSFGGGGAGGSW